MRYVWLLILVAMVSMLAPAQVASAQGNCTAEAFRQFDMVGAYVSPESQMRVEIYPCGGSVVMWDNAYGRHTAVYASYDRLVGNGVMASGIQVDPISGGYLDSSYSIAFKPAEPGYIIVGTFKPYDESVRTYRLKKIQ